MRHLILIIFLCFPFFANSSLNGIHLFCERTEDYLIKDKEIENENYIFIFFKQNNFDKKKIIKHVFSNKIDFTLDLYNRGKYNFDNENINLIDDLIFREKRLKSKLNRNTMILKSNFKDTIMFEHVCEISNLKKSKKKSQEIINKLKKFWQNKFKNNKM